jgi:hypothetical protein
VSYEIVGHGLGLADDLIGAGIEATVGQASEPVRGCGGPCCVLADEDTGAAGKQRFQQQDEEVEMSYSCKNDIRPHYADQVQ